MYIEAVDVAANHRNKTTKDFDHMGKVNLAFRYLFCTFADNRKTKNKVRIK